MSRPNQEPLTILETVALVIGSYFFEVRSDDEAISKGTPAAKSVLIALGNAIVRQGSR